MSCPACFTGAVRHDEKPTGHEATIHGRPTYIASPPDNLPPKGVIIIVPDAFGWQFINNRILADNYARKGQFLVYLPDFMDGTATSTSMIATFYYVLATSTLWDWVSKPYHVSMAIYHFVPFLVRNRYGVTMPRVDAFFSAVRENEAKTIPVGTAGFCWGGKHVVNLADGSRKSGDGKPYADACFTAHPSGLDVPAEVEKCRIPLSVAIGDQDFVMDMKQVEVVKATLNKPGANDLNELVLYPGAGHGFSIRADMGNEKQSEQAIAAEDQAVAFFQKVFARVKH